MMGRRRALVFLCTLVLSVAGEEAPPGLVSKDSDHDLLAEATNAAPQAQKREAALSNSYGEPLPADAYGPPRDIPIVPDAGIPAPVYGPPQINNNIFQTPPGAYGPPSPIVFPQSFPSQTYQGPPPPVFRPKPHYGPPKQTYGPPKPIYGPPKQVYGPPKKTYGPPKQSLPKPTYGAPFKPPKFSIPKQTYGPPKQVYGPPKPVYGPPKVTYGAPINFQSIPLDLPQHNLGIQHNSIDLGLSLPAPIYGTPLPNLPLDLKPNFPIPAETYGPPGHTAGPIGPGPEVVQGLSNVQYGPPQPDPNPRPPHPGIPAPPTPPHVLYDGWKPIPGVSLPNIEQHAHHVEDQYGPPPPAPVQEIHINLDGNDLPNIEQHHQFSGAQINTGYSSVHQDALANIDLNAIVGGDSNHIDQSKTVFEAHYTENQQPQNDVTFIQQTLPSGPDITGLSAPEKPFDTYGAPPLDSLSNGPYPGSIRQQGAKGLIPPSGVYGVPPGSQYGAPPRPPPANLPIPYGSFSGGGHSIHTGGQTPRHPIKFRDSVPEGLIQTIGHVTHHKDHHGSDHFTQGPAYLPPPIRDVKDVNQDLGNHGISSLSLSIEPTNLYSLPHAGNPINFQSNQQPSSLYGSPVDSYSVPLFTVGDNAGSASSVNEVKATIDGSIFANLSNLDAAAILKHCPYHEAIIKAAQSGDKIPSDLASSYVASLSSLGSALSKNQNSNSISYQNEFHGLNSESVSYSNKDLASSSQTIVQTVVPNEIKQEKTEKNSLQKGKSLKDESKNSFRDNNFQFVSDQIFQTSEKIKNLSEETKQLQHKIVTTSQSLNQVSGQINNLAEIPVKGKLGSYSLQIQSADSPNGKNIPSIPHEQLLSEGLLQSILQAIEHPNQKPVKQISFGPTNSINLASLDAGGLVLPAGYEPVDHTKLKQSPNKVQFQNHQGHSYQGQSQQGQNHQGQNYQGQTDQGQTHQEQTHQGHTHQGQTHQEQTHQGHTHQGQTHQGQTHQEQTHQGHTHQGQTHQGQTHQGQPDQGQIHQEQTHQGQNQQTSQVQHQSLTIDQEIQSTNKDIKKILHSEIIHKHRGDIPYTECDLKSEHSIQHRVIVPAPKNEENIDNVTTVDEVDMNDVAIFFNEKDEKEPVTEISVATSISENTDDYNNGKKAEFGDKIKKS